MNASAGTWPSGAGESAYRLPCEDVLAASGVGIDDGLDAAEARARFNAHGPNQLHQVRPRSVWSILAGQLKSIVVGLLVVAMGVSFLVGDTIEGAAILVVIATNSAIGFFTEMRARRSMESLRKLGGAETRVRRERRVISIPAERVVPGDIVVVEGGDVITVDLRIIRASKLMADESALTGESVPVSKHPDAIGTESVLGERFNMLFKGTSITRGSGEGVVTATGMHTELGKISSLVEDAKDEATPLEAELNRLGGWLVWVIVLITAIVVGLGVARGKELWPMVETGIALAVASIPEGLPIVATIALSRGMLRMARRQALVRRLASVETLGSTSVICTDKTGTLTENRMTLERVEIADRVYERAADAQWSCGGAAMTLHQHPLFERALELGVLCNNATASSHVGGVSGDPLELSLLLAAVENGMDPAAIRGRSPELREDAFDSDTKTMATYHERGGGVLIAVKGAPEAVVRSCTMRDAADGQIPLDDLGRAALKKRAEALGAEGYRLIAVAYREAGSVDEPPYESLTWVALLGLVDPPRNDIRETIAVCQRAGIRVIMVTGDLAQTAHHVARAVGIAGESHDAVVNGTALEDPSKLAKPERDRLREVRVFSRVSPKQKLELVALHQEAGSVVAMTGDGVNDAPALKKSDIGVAMGQRGTQVAREVADVVLKDDSFGTIVYAIREGRVIFGNIRKFVLYLLSCNIAEIMVIFVATIANMPLPILPLQILFLNLVTDVFPALALGAGEGHDRVMNEAPRERNEPILTRKHWIEITAYGVAISTAVLAAFVIAQSLLNWTPGVCVTVSFLTLAMAQLWHVLDMREHDANLFSNQMTRNRFVWGALALCVALLIGAVYVRPIGEVLGTVAIGPAEWGLVAVCSILPVIFDAVGRSVYRVAPR